MSEGSVKLDADLENEKSDIHEINTLFLAPENQNKTI